MKEKLNQFGRSMIEMLGVLAIVGVLSVGGLAGYNTAMRKVRLNQFISDMEIAAFHVKSVVLDKRGVENEQVQPFVLNSQEWKNMVDSFKSVGGRNISLGCLASSSSYCFVVYDLKPDVCREMVNSGIFASFSLLDHYSKPDNDEEQKQQTAADRASMLALCDKVEKYSAIDFSVRY